MRMIRNLCDALPPPFAGGKGRVGEGELLIWLLLGLFASSQKQDQKLPLPNSPLRFAQGKGLFCFCC